MPSTVPESTLPGTTGAIAVQGMMSGHLLETVAKWEQPPVTLWRHFIPIAEWRHFPSFNAQRVSAKYPL
eukprot:scaffold207560_cov17-Tisochrysis_lutea.AAC.1